MTVSRFGRPPISSEQEEQFRTLIMHLRLTVYAASRRIGVSDASGAKLLDRLGLRAAYDEIHPRRQGPDQRIARLRELIEGPEQLSIGEAAERLEITRNVACGMCFRHNIRSTKRSGYNSKGNPWTRTPEQREAASRRTTESHQRRRAPHDPSVVEKPRSGPSHKHRVLVAHFANLPELPPVVGVDSEDVTVYFNEADELPDAPRQCTPPGLPLLALRRDGCRWPVWPRWGTDAGLGAAKSRGDYRFCGEASEEGQSFCCEHRAMAYDKSRGGFTSSRK